MESDQNQVFSSDLIKNFFHLFLDVVWWVASLVLLVVYGLPPFINVFVQPWTAAAGFRDPLLTYAADGASLGLGTGIYMTNHPGTPVHEFFALMTRILQWALGLVNQGGSFTSGQMRDWILLHTQTLVFLSRFLAPVGYVALLVTIALCAKSLLGNRWLALPAIILVASAPPVRSFAVFFAIESVYPAVFIIAATVCFAFPYPISLRRLFLGCFIVAFLISLKIIHLPVLLIYLYFLWARKDFIVSPRIAQTSMLLAGGFLPGFFLCSFVYILLTKYEKLFPSGRSKLIILIIFMAGWLLCFSLSGTIRSHIKQRSAATIALLLTTFFFFCINIPMAWKAWIGFLLNAQGGFDRYVFLQYMTQILVTPLLCWSFMVGFLMWGRHILFGRFSESEPFERLLFLSQTLVLYLVWIGAYLYRPYNLIPFILISTILSMAAIPFLFRHFTVSTREKRSFFPVCIGITALIPLLLSYPSFSLRPALRDLGQSISSLDHFSPEEFTQGLDKNGKYTKTAFDYLQFANEFSAFHFLESPDAKIKGIENH